MDNTQTICLLNDSFPPLIDGVANTVLNYASQIQRSGLQSMVVTPANPDADDKQFSYSVVRYPSIVTQKFEGYPAGVPFSPEVARNVTDRNIALLHTHCPVMSTFMTRQLWQITNAPIVFTYHTKFDVDIEHIVKSKPIQLAAKKVLVSNISACDEVWAVSHGTGENLRSLGYEGDYIVMSNGVDMPCERATEEQIQAATNGYDFPQDVPVYLFVGRMMWYKGLRIIVDALARLKIENRDFRMVFIGDGDDREQIEAYASDCGIRSKCIFTGAIRDRKLLRGWYSRADLFLFPSCYDTNGLVVREAAACSLASVLIKGSYAAEGVADNRNGFLIEENAESMAHCLSGMTKELLAAVESDEQTVQDMEREKIDLKLFLETTRECTDLKELTPTLVNTLIKRIEVHSSTVDEKGVKHVPVDIHFTAVGIINIPDAEEILQIMKEIRTKPLRIA